MEISVNPARAKAKYAKTPKKPGNSELGKVTQPDIEEVVEISVNPAKAKAKSAKAPTKQSNSA